MTLLTQPDPAVRQLEHLYRLHRSWLQKWLQSRLGNHSDAADIAHDTFLRLLTAPEHSREKQGGWQLQEPRSYLTLVAKRLMSNLQRRRALEAAYLGVLAQQPQLQAPSPEERLQIIETLLKIDLLLDDLPGKVRSAFLLAQLEGLGYARIAERLGVSERSVKRYVAQALAHCILAMEQ